MTGTLILCATPIGNLADTTTRLAETLNAADVVYAEDTRRTAKLLRHLGISARMKSYFAGNEQKRNDELADLLRDGMVVALVSDAGMPVVSDPGSSAVQVAVDVGATVTAIPGANAPLTALAISGFSGDRFVFEGFLPRKGADRTARLESLADDERTTVLFAATRRVGTDLADLSKYLGDARSVVIARELTKMHEEVWRGTVGDAAVYFGDAEEKGEFTIVIRGAVTEPVDLDSALESARAAIEAGDSISRAARSVAASTGVSRRELYDRLVKDGQ